MRTKILLKYNKCGHYKISGIDDGDWSHYVCWAGIKRWFTGLSKTDKLIIQVSDRNPKRRGWLKLCLDTRLSRVGQFGTRKRQILEHIAAHHFEDILKKRKFNIDNPLWVRIYES